MSAQSPVAHPVPTLRGDRVLLRVWRREDAAALFELFSDPVFMRYWSRVVYKDVAEVRNYIDLQLTDLARFEFYPWAITLHGDDKPIGNCTLFAINRDNLRCDLGYGLSPALQGQGLASEAVKLAVNFAFNEIGLHRVETDIDPRNQPSCRLVERLGFQREGLLRQRWHVNGEITDSVLHGLLRTDPR
ncbi:MAG: GNAT family protein [Dokdonella sp.]